MQKLATENTPEAMNKLKHYVLEAARLSYVISLLRICVPADGAGQLSIKDDKVYYDVQDSRRQTLTKHRVVIW